MGEYTALTASGALDFEDAVKLVTERGEAMQACAESQEGTMAAILGLDDELVESVCHRVDDGFFAGLNSFSRLSQAISGSMTVKYRFSQGGPLVEIGENG